MENNFLFTLEKLCYVFHGGRTAGETHRAGILTASRPM